MSCEEISQELKVIIEEIYGIFSKYEWREEFLTGAHLNEGNIKPIGYGKIPIRELTEDQMYRVATDIYYGADDLPQDYKVFLPRVLEIMITRPAYMTEVVLGKLNNSPKFSWKTWPENEKRAIEKYLIALWKKIILCENLFYFYVEEYLCAISLAYGGVNFFLAIWEEELSLSPIKALTAFIEYNEKNLFEAGELSNAFWPQDLEQQVSTWLLDLQTLELVRTKSKEFSDSETQEAANELIALLSKIQKTANNNKA